MKFSIVPAIFLAVCAFWIWAARSARVRGEIGSTEVRSIHAWLAILSAWAVASALMSISGFYRSAVFYALWPGLWVPLAPVFLTLSMLAAWPTFRGALWAVTSTTTPRAFFLVQGLRVLAIGGVIKGYQGLLPGSFAYLIGIPDLAYGLVSLALYRASVSGDDAFTSRTVVLWNLAGIAVLLAAPVLMQLALPGPAYLLRAQPDASVLFDFPMVLAPTLVVTWLFFMNGWHALVTWRGRRFVPPVRGGR